MSGGTSGRPLRVVVFNDSPTILAVIRSVLAKEDELEVVAEAQDGTGAAELCRQFKADLVLMDIVMPRCNGYEATRAIMTEVPTPIVMVSSALDTRSSDVLFEAMKAGALFVTEPPPAGQDPSSRMRQAAFVQTVRNVAAATLLTEGGDDVPAVVPPPRTGGIEAIGICASAGGPAVLTEVLSRLPAPHMPPILIVQHLAYGFCHTFAQWLARESNCRVEVAADGAKLSPGIVYLAPDDRHLLYGPEGYVRLTQDPKVGVFRPSATLMLESLGVLGTRALGVILSGMGDDGAKGAVALRERGGRVVVQNRASCAVFGMPEAALKSGGADDVLSPREISEWLVRNCGVRS